MTSHGQKEVKIKEEILSSMAIFCKTYCSSGPDTQPYINR